MLIITIVIVAMTMAIIINIIIVMMMMTNNISIGDNIRLVYLVLNFNMYGLGDYFMYIIINVYI